MRIIQLIPGSGDNFYCENCLRDGALSKALRERGHDAVVVPLYLPLQMDEAGVEAGRDIFFGGINVYLQQKFSLFRRTPRWIDRVFDARGLLAWAGRRTGMTATSELAETTLSMLRGENGRQVKELNRLVDWLKTQPRPDVVCLSNVLLAGMAGQIRRELQAPVVCLLQDEDEFVDALGEPHREQVWGLLAERAKDVDVFVAVSKSYAGAMQERLGVAGDKMQVVYNGVAAQEYGPAQPSCPTIGYLSRICRDKGLDRLVEAFAKLKRDDRLSKTKLRIAGGQGGDDAGFAAEIQRRLARDGLGEDVEFVSGLDRTERLAFLQSLSVMSVPERRAAASGLYVLEAWACGVPVVQPRRGVFCELLETGGGGILVDEPSQEEDYGAELAGALGKLLREPDYARELGQRGREAVAETFNVQRMAKETEEVFEQTVAGGMRQS